MDEDLSASVVIKNKNNVWVPDNMVTHCYACKKEFGIWIRKHHCRNCGNIFCHKCISQSIVIPHFITDRPDVADYWNISHYIKILKSEKEKVCSACYKLIREKTAAYERILKIFNNPVSIDKIKELSESNADIKSHYFDHLRNIQYYLPNHIYSILDKKLLFINAIYFTGHSKYIVHLIKSINWKEMATRPTVHPKKDDEKTIDEYATIIMEILNAKKNKMCHELYCTRTCRDVLTCDDCVNILYSTQEYLPDCLMEYLLDIILKTSEQVILCQLSFFTNLIKINNSNKLLQKKLFELLNQTLKLIYHTYWFLNNAKETANVQETKNINNFIALFDSTITKKMHLEYMFYAGLITNLDDPVKYLTNTFSAFKPISLPYEPNIHLLNFDASGITVKSSYTKPVIIPFETTIGRIQLLFKRESIMNDIVVLNLMTLSDIILMHALDGERLGVVIYPTMPLTANSGMIEIIDRAETIHSIISSNKNILQYIVEKNEHKVPEVLDKYMYSLVSYTLHSYFIGFGDRHPANIMITEEGAIFHIDFGFILGTDAYPLTASDIKLNSNMLDVIGGSDSHRTKIYLELCSKGIRILRKYFNIFFILLSTDLKYSIKHVEKFILSRFQPRQIDSIIVEELMTIIKQSSTEFMSYFRDFLHYHKQEKTVQNGLGKIIGAVIGAVKGLTKSDD